MLDTIMRSGELITKCILHDLNVTVHRIYHGRNTTETNRKGLNA